MTGTTLRIELQLEVERLVAYEAYLLDERRFHEWLELFTDDATYAVSVRELGLPVRQVRPDWNRSGKRASQVWIGYTLHPSSPASPSNKICPSAFEIHTSRLGRIIVGRSSK